MHFFHIFIPASTHIFNFEIKEDNPRVNLSYTGNWTKCPGAEPAAASSRCKGEDKERKKYTGQVVGN